MDLGLTDRKVVVTGGSKGIGLATARTFGAEGADVVIVGRDAAALDAAAEDLRGTGRTIMPFAADLSRDDERERLFAAHGDADILVNNAGAIPAGDISTVTMDAWRKGWDLKVWGYIHLCKLFVGAMTERRGGTIVNVIGMGGRAVRPGYIAGASGNAALIGFTQALGAGTPKDDVRVFGINPSATLTDRIRTMARVWAEERFGDPERWEEVLDQSKMPFGRIKLPEEVGALAAMLCAPQVHYLSGTVIDMDGGGQWAG
jgi:NAD(P)-dependent dehydrogenase (short-subunit alcohol dehydrogenase family)